ncbi:aldehyde dehydrogenase family protein [Chitinophaga silvatica]|uniref:Aldehyde dehydrogenase family protein n=1 Tax=Chitinophaga silvatica TaxID=2282649 RepID=A0A3E1YEI5_9BACT|nr:aldehyde dehydrogenase family protein [Chitinophaga silvatica]RFS24970.1 aldehyde dehydrogenase family protein [Chitinophaga silvatica]
MRPNVNRSVNVFNPATGEYIKTIDSNWFNDPRDETLTIKTMHLSWLQTTLQERIQLMQNFGKQLETRKDKLANLLTDEVGKPLWQSVNEINGAISRVKWMTDNAEKFLSDEWVTHSDNMKERISYDPIGIVAVISAWNYPYLVGVNAFVAALLAGNTVLYKPSEYAMLTGMEIDRLMYYSGVGNNAFKLILGGSNVGEQLTSMPLDGYCFTGSYNSGLKVRKAVSDRLIPVQLEMGGKDPVYVMDDIQDIPKVAAAVADGAFYNNGQSCCAIERVYVHEAIYDEFLKSFLEVVKSWKLGYPKDENVYFGAITRKEQISILLAQVEDALKYGATLQLGGRKIAHAGNYFEPTVLTEVNHNMKVMMEESFGPIIGIMKVKDDSTAIKLMNDTEYGLTASVFSTSQERAESVLSKVNSGTAYWNCCDRVAPGLPWSGRKNSGFGGATLSHLGLRQFTKPRGWQLRSVEAL